MYPSSHPPPDSTIAIQIASQHARLVYPGPHLSSKPFSREICRIQSALDILAHRCIFCWVLQQDHARSDHLLKLCTFGPNIYTTHRDQWKSWRRRIQFPDGVCFGCGCPQHVRMLSFTVSPPQTDFCSSSPIQKTTNLVYSTQITTLNPINVAIGTLFSPSHGW
jgi:hypothetical protein